MTVERTGRMVTITPKPAILKALARIEFDPWQCVAELVDNSFDEFIDIRRSGETWTEPFDVSVSLPNQAAFGQVEAAIVVSDNGRGMTLERVVDAASAGFSGNDPISKLGLFGMGFNVATVRMGAVTRFFTTRAGDSDWVGVEIDVDAIREGYEVPEVRRPKETPSQHGTRVEVSRLEGFSQWFTRATNQTRLRETLGGLYSYLLGAEAFRLFVNGIAVKPYRHCVWSRDRSVTRDNEVIPAVVDLDFPLGDRAVCRACGLWQDVDNESCERCGKRDLEVRTRRVWGWLGVQRYLDGKEFGVDFLRNGRKIMRFDRNVFQWRDPDAPGGQGEIEYPIELPTNMGRIVGEVHLDHVPVVYTKDAFDTADTGWRKAMELVRGSGPLRPKRAKELNYPQNDSPLARLYRGYRRNDPGRNYLTPGNGKVRVDFRDWDRAFRDGDPQFQDDRRWWEAIVEHERLVEDERERKLAREQGDGGLPDPTIEFSGEPGLDEPEAPPVVSTPPAQPPTDAERVEQLSKSGSPILELDAEFMATGVPGRPVKLSAWRVSGQTLVGSNGRRAPTLLIPGRASSVNAFVDVDHPHFRMFPDEPVDMILIELAQHLLVRAQGSVTSTISTVYAELKERYLPTHAIDPVRLIGEASQILRDVQERMVACVADNPMRPWLNVLNQPERFLTGDRLTEAFRSADINPFLESGEYLPFVPPGVVPRIVEDWPEAFFDGRLFDGPYSEVSSATARRQTVAAIAGYLDDISWLASGPANASRDELVRATLSLRLMPEHIIPA